VSQSKVGDCPGTHRREWTSVTVSCS